MLDFILPTGQGRLNTGQKKDFSIIIPHRGSDIGLWATINSCEVDLANTDYNYEYIIVVNGQPILPELRLIFNHLDAKHRLGDLIYHSTPLAPPSARQLGSEAAVGEYLFFFDNHCIVWRDYFKRALERMKQFDMDCLHSGVHYSYSECHYHYVLTLDQEFYAYSSTKPKFFDRPYKIAASGHGGFIVKKSVFDAVGGYGPIEMFQGWAGEEMYFNLKLAMFGYTAWLDPQLKHFHYASESRGYPKSQSPNFYLNFMIAANSLGGIEAVEPLFKMYVDTCSGLNKEELTKLKEEAILRSSPHHQWIVDNAKYTLSEALENFKTKDIVY